MSATRWTWIARSLFVLFLAAVALLLARYVREVDWSEVGAALAGYGLPTLLGAAALTGLSYALYAGYDLGARRYADHGLGKGRVTAIALVSYAFNLNLGSLVGGAGFRYRLYRKAGARGSDVARVLGFSVSANWLGYALLAGALFALREVPVPRGWELGTTGLQVLGIALLLACAGYLFACARWHDRTWRVRGHALRLPSLRLALLQFALAACNWLVIAAIHYLLLRGEVEYARLLGVALLAAIAGAVTHIPAGIGALEAVFLALLGSRVGVPELLAELLVFRAVYYLVPLMLALPLYLALEIRGRRASRAKSGAAAAP